MLKSISLKCVNCGADLDITTEMSDFVCGYCGAAQAVKRTGGTVSLKPSADSALKIRDGVDETAEAAIKRLKEELQVTESSLKKLEVKKQREINKKSRTALGIWGALTFVCLILMLLSGISSAFIMPVFIGLTVIALILFKKTYEKISEKYETSINSLATQTQEIKKRLEESEIK
jgi:DNA-directed RNA polymerase subunit RPC12/RpoP/Flp pilus assembly protein TadB